MKHLIKKTAVLTMALVAAISFSSCGTSSSNSNVEDLDKLFSEGIIFLKKNGTLVAVNPSGEIVFEPEYDVVYPFHDGLARVWKKDTYADGGWMVFGTYSYIDKKGDEVLKLEYPELQIEHKYAQYISYQKEKHGITQFYPVYFPNGENKNPQYDSHIFSMKYYEAKNYNDGRCRVEIYWDNGWPGQGTKGSFYRFLDKCGNIISDDFEGASDFCEGYAKVGVIGRSCMYIDTTGKYVTPSYLSKDTSDDNTPLKYYSAESFHNGFAVVGKEDEISGDIKYGVINRRFQQIIPFYYDEIRDFEDGRFIVCINKNNFGRGLWGAVDSTGKTIVPQKYSFFENFSEGLAAVCLEGSGWGFVDINGNTVIPFEYSKVESFDQGIAKVNRDGCDWYINKRNKEIKIDRAKYDMMTDFHKGIAIVGHLGEYGVVDATGKEIIPMKYNEIIIDKNGFIWVCDKGKWGVVSRKNKILIPIEFDNPFK